MTGKSLRAPTTVMSAPSSRTIQAVVFAEGGSLRLRPLTEHLPTCLVPVGGTPILDQQLQSLLRVGVRSITVVGGYRAIQVEQACRAYAGVTFRANPRFSRGEPHRSSLLTAGVDPENGCLLVRGDLVFEDALIADVLRPDLTDAHVVGASGRGVGIYRLCAVTLQCLLEAAGSVPVGAQNELFPWIDAMVTQAGSEAIQAQGRAWARVSTMEDLARALKACRDSRSARVAEAEEHLGGAAPRPENVPVVPLEPPAEPDPIVDSSLPALGMGSLSRALLRVHPR
jgi:choline kinase